jgi:hypothetical protein
VTTTRKRKAAPSQADALAFFEELGPYATGGGRYTRADRYRDFRKVLLEGGASADEAKRVLWQMFEETRLFRTPVTAGDTHLTYARIGKQEIGRWLLAVLTTPPAAETAAPERAESEA